MRCPILQRAGLAGWPTLRVPTAYFAFRKSATSSRMNSLSSCLLRLAAGRVGEVVVVGDDDLGRVDDIDILDGHEREGELAVLAALLGELLGIGDVHQVDVADLAGQAAGVGVGHLDLVDALELGRDVEAVGRRLAFGAGLVRGALAVVALDDEAGGGVDHVEVADVVAVDLERRTSSAGRSTCRPRRRTRGCAALPCRRPSPTPSFRRPRAGPRAADRGTCRPWRRPCLHSRASGAR